MRNFADLLCKDDPADAATPILGYMMDLISSTCHALMDADAHNAERLAHEATTALLILHACAVRVDVGVEMLQREAKRGGRRPRASTGAETH
jgi:hypothetical protein